MLVELIIYSIIFVWLSFWKVCLIFRFLIVLLVFWILVVLIKWKVMLFIFIVFLMIFCVVLWILFIIVLFLFSRIFSRVDFFVLVFLIIVIGILFFMIFFILNELVRCVMIFFILLVSWCRVEWFVNFIFFLLKFSFSLIIEVKFSSFLCRVVNFLLKLLCIWFKVRWWVVVEEEVIRLVMVLVWFKFILLLRNVCWVYFFGCVMWYLFLISSCIICCKI